MTPTLEIIIPVRNPDARLLQTVASLASQTDRRFEVRLGDNSSTSGRECFAEAIKQLTAAGIAVQQPAASGELKRLEHWNRLHAGSPADWIKPLLAGEVLKPGYVERLRQCLETRPQAQMVRCDAEARTEWGLEILRAPHDRAFIGAGEFLDHFPARIDWMARAVNVAYHRRAWLATGGYCLQLPGFATLNLNVTLALHHGMENISEPLAVVSSGDRLPLNESCGEHVNLPLELWLILRQARNYSFATGLPWPGKWPSLRALAAALGRW